MATSDINERIENGSSTRSPDESRPATPLPKLQLFIVLLMQAAEPISSTVIFPFINQWVRETGVTHGDEAKTGYYAGVIGSIFFIAECVTVLFWGRASDRFGRKPILLLGMLGLSFSMFSAGLSTSYLPLVLSRAAQGMFNGNVGVCKNVMAEITDSTNIADAFAFIPFMWTAGASIGPLLGGALARPAERWPAKFGKLELLRSHPYFLACASAGVFSVFAFIIGSVYLNETLPAIVKRKKMQALQPNSRSGLLRFSRQQRMYSTLRPPAADGSSVVDESTANLTANLVCSTESSRSSPPIRAVLIRPVALSLITCAFQAFASQSWHVLLPLMYSTSIPVGGLGLDAPQIGVILAVIGVLAGSLQVMVFGRSVRRFGARRMYQVSFGTFLVTIGLFPVLSSLAKAAGHIDGRVKCVMGVQLLAFTITAMSHGSNTIYIISSVPDNESLATVNGLTQLVGSAVRALGPSFTASLFSVSLERQLLGGYMVYLCLVGVILLGIFASFKLPKNPKASS
ncbi:hypothetical protein HGRIS_005055 [Hohenbuehelia grisea]|uniref:Major facilitator superfamily (MFS) profile domain-containing protein n=1 Tax=Hohenbuehelia grisea TaxID=104357 RepID=A0ABR3JDT4_9AGAR